ncbi:MAG: YtoQ family protein [Balneolia bacterium]|nr:YtoQ family protein [Balneolia bacterium]
MKWTIYLAGEIHSDWRTELQKAADSKKLNVEFTGPVTDHPASDNCGVHILGDEEDPFWKDRKGAGLNAIRTRTLLEKADVVVVKFGEKYRQWNAAFDAGYASALGKPLIIVHPEEFDHALKEVDEAANAVARDHHQVVDILEYVTEGRLN